VLPLAEFELLVENALRCIPWRFRRLMKNVAIVVEQEPPRPGLLGLYQGRPLASRSVFEGFTMPDKITIFQGPHERLSRTRAELEQMVTDTVWHETAHHFGMDEARVRRGGTAEGKLAPERATLSLGEAVNS
jgi:predicted Zn-dependent protease with MMP-like domain